MWIKIDNTSWNEQEVLKHERQSFVDLPQHRAIIKGSEEKKTEVLETVYSICSVKQKLFHENSGPNAEPGAEPEPAGHSTEIGEENTATTGASEPGPDAERPKRKRNANKTLLQANHPDDKEAEGTGDPVGNP